MSTLDKPTQNKRFSLPHLLSRLIIRCAALAAITLMSMTTFSINGAEESINIQKVSSEAPQETMHFGRIVGQWSIKDQTLGKDGQWQDGPGANWNFYWILGGNAIQDDWISPGFETPAPKVGRQLGTNIRIYNPVDKVWEMAWISSSGRKLDTFKATSDENSMVMDGIYNGQATRITFFDISEKRFSWKMERQDKTSDKWSSIYKIEAYRIKE